MSKKSFASKAIALIAGAAMLSIAVPGAASAEEIFAGKCVLVPFAVPGVTVAGQRVVPAMNYITVCAYDNIEIQVFAPRVVQYNDCGTPCFAVWARVAPVYASSLGGGVYVYYADEGGTSHWPVYQPIAGDGQDPSDGQELCVLGVGTQDPCRR
jgi:hypothetical protein